MSQPVYFTTMRTEPSDSIPAKLKRLLDAAGLPDSIPEGGYVAIKTHFGEQGNVSHLRPEYTRAVADTVRDYGGVPFATDCSTLYVGMRNNALDHMECAALNGFSPQSCGCQIYIADGLRGTDEVEIPVPGGEYLKTALVGRGIMDADLVITLTHSKGCTAAAYGGALKNLGMGCASRAGKMVMHSKGVPSVQPEVCIGCGMCLDCCGQNAIEFIGGKARITETCVGCGHCISYCPNKAIVPAWNRKWEDLQYKMAEYAAALSAAKRCFHVAIAIDITPQCDCFAGNDAPMVPNIGMFASTDPVALDQAVTDAICAQPAIENAALPEKHAACVESLDHLHANNPASDWELCIEHAAKLGAGVRDYELIGVK